VSTKSKLPKSKAKTAYGLLSEVRRLILAEPKRYNQYCLLTVRSSRSNALRGNYFTDFPSCGTIGCVAGWVATLKADSVRGDIWNKARHILGLDEREGEILFWASAAQGPSQSLQHARNGAKHIARFQTRHAAQLKAKRV